MSATWDRKFMLLAQHVAGWSKDRSRHVGCVIVGPHREIRATGFNGFPRGIDDGVEERHQRPTKYSWTEHAERNAIYNSARAGVSLDGCTLFVSNLFPCVDCARAMIQVGIATVVACPPNFKDATWGEQFRIAGAMFDEAGLTVRRYSEVSDDDP